MLKVSKSKKIGTSILALVLCVSMTACTTNQVLADINVLIQIAASIGSAVGPLSGADSAVIIKLSQIASAGMAAIQAAYTTYQNSGATTDLQKVLAAIGACQTNLQQELAAAHITDQATVQKVTNWVNLIYSTLAAVVAALPQLQAGAKATPVKVSSINISVTPQSLKSRWSNEVCGGNKACTDLVVVKGRF